MSGAELLHVEWRAPAWWLIALTPLAFVVLARWRKPVWRRYAEPHLQPWAIKQGAAIKRGRLRTVTAWGFWFLLACALAGPRLPLEALSTATAALSPSSLPQAGERDSGPLRELHRHDMDVFIVLDVSPSMAASDIAPNRLLRAKLKLQDLAARLHGERLGLIVYSGEAGLLLPLTRDRQAFSGSLPLATAALFEDKGSYLAAALDLARRSFGDARRSRAVLLLTDAEASSLSGDAGNAAVHAARALQTAGIPLYVLALASTSGAAIPLADGGTLTQNGAQIISRPDIAGYGALAEMTGGKLALVSDGENDLAALYDNGMLALPAAHDARDKTLAWRELFPYPLALALLLLLAGQLRFTRRGVLVAAALAASGTAQADDAAWRDAHQAYRQGQYLIAQSAYHTLDGFPARMGEGAAAYRRKDYVYAGKQFTLALLQADNNTRRADALFNLGDSDFYAGNLIAAADAFDGVLRYRPNDQRAQNNLAHVRSTLARLGNQLPQTDGIPGRRGRGLGQGEADAASPMGMAPGKNETRPMVNPNATDARAARRLGLSARSAQSDLDADRRAALKKLDLLTDRRAETLKQVLKQDATRDPPQGMPPW